MKLELRRITVASPEAHNARQRWPERQSLLLRCSDAQGRAGLGEASPLPGYSPDSLAAVEAALATVKPDDFERALAHTDMRRALEAAGALVSDALPAARLALETAALDYRGQCLQQSAPALLGAKPEAVRPLAQLVGSAGGEAFLKQCERAGAAGFQVLKVKLGSPGALERELEAFEAAAARFPTITWRLDANGALSTADLAQAWPRLQRLRVELFEEPGVVSDLPRDFPLGLDESFQRVTIAAALERLADTGARFAVLKPTTLGLAHCWELSRRAEAQGAVAIVSHCFEGPVAFRAAAALALALPRVVHGLAPHAGLAGWPEPQLPIQAAQLHSWPEPGLGLRPGSVFE